MIYFIVDVPIMEELHTKKRKTYYRRGDHSITSIGSKSLQPEFYLEKEEEEQEKEKEESKAEKDVWLNECFYI